MTRASTAFDYGFRIFFLSCATYAVAVMAAWIGVFTFGWGIAGSRPLQWHAHEMIFGMTTAAIAGFLLTAVPNWTGTRRVHGPGLVALWMVWLVARIGYWLTDPGAPGAWSTAVRVLDLAFLPALAAAIAIPILRTRNYRNLPMVVLLAALFTTNAAHGDTAWSGPATLLALDLVMIIMIVIGGRITPLFTRNWLTRCGFDAERVQSHAWLDWTGLLLVAATAVATLAGAPDRATGALAFAAGLANLARLLEWQGWRAWRDPLVWVLHLGYAWIVVALLIRGLGEFTPALPVRAWFHALGAGAIGTLLAGVMSRVALGHTGRKLQLPAGASAIFWAVTVAAVARTGNALGLFDHAYALTVAGLAWITAFALYIVFFAPVLLAPRVDGKPG